MCKSGCKRQEEPYGLVIQAIITIWGALREAQLFSTKNSRDAWKLTDRGDLDDEDHTNVYLDCHLRDSNSIDEPRSGIYVVPVANTYDVGSGTHERTSNMPDTMNAYDMH
jgi:hypothetical protein